MRGLRWVVLAVCCIVMAIGSPAAEAGGEGTMQGGTLTFVGAIVEPTCNVPAERVMSVMTGEPGHAPQRFGCGQAGPGAVPASSYVASIRPLSDDEQDRVLKYFDAYLKADKSARAAPMLLTQTYE